MHKAAKTARLAVLLISAIAILAGPATAASFRFEPQGTIEAPSEGKITLGEGSTTVQCEITLKGTISSALLAKIAGTQFGSITAMLINEEGCTGGEIESGGLLGFPWRFTYNSILGTLPAAVTGLLVLVERFQVNLTIFGGFVNCLYEGNVGILLALTGTNPYTTGRATLLGSRLRLIRGGFGCPSSILPLGMFLFPPQRLTRL